MPYTPRTGRDRDRVIKIDDLSRDAGGAGQERQGRADPPNCTAGGTSATVAGSSSREELHRLYPARATGEHVEDMRQTPEGAWAVGSWNGDAPVRVARHETLQQNAATAEIALLRELLTKADATIEDLRARLDRESEDRRKADEDRRRVTALLTDQRPELPRGVFWFFTRRTSRG